MILSTHIDVKVSNQGQYYANLGYENTKQGSLLKVVIKDLPLNSNKFVKALCDCCESEFERQYQLLNKQPAHLCKECSYLERVNGVDYSKVAESNKNRIGVKHPRWNHRKTEFETYKREVMRITNRQATHLLENSDKPRGRCGVEGAYQLDHIVSIKKGFDSCIPPDVIGDIQNLQFIPWSQNRNKWF